MARIPALVAVHDAMPETLDRVLGVLDLLDARGVTPITVLVVPGRSWTARDIDVLRGLQGRGVVLAGHGWTHEAQRIRGLRHRLHSLLLSRRAAEHLALDGAGVEALVRRCHAWFSEHGLASPALYVPPAWALGGVGREALDRLPFSRYEVLNGVYDVPSGRLLRLPLVGYEADSAWRVPPLRLWNALNRRRASPAAPLRVGIHPLDLTLRLADDLHRLLDRPLACRGYADLTFG
jgi:predicted deacetylase